MNSEKQERCRNVMHPNESHPRRETCWFDEPAVQPCLVVDGVVKSLALTNPGMGFVTAAQPGGETEGLCEHAVQSKPTCKHECGIERPHTMCRCAHCGTSYSNPESTPALASAPQQDKILIMLKYVMEQYCNCVGHVPASVAIASRELHLEVPTISGVAVQEGQGAEQLEVEALWRTAGLPEWFLGNGGTNHKLYAFADAVTASRVSALTQENTRLNLCLSEGDQRHKALTEEVEQSRQTNRELNRRNSSLEHALARESGKGSWYGYWRAASRLYSEAYDKNKTLRAEMERLRAGLNDVLHLARQASTFASPQWRRNSLETIKRVVHDAALGEAGKVGE